MITVVFPRANPSSIDTLLAKVIIASTLVLQVSQSFFNCSIAVAALIYAYFQELKAADNSIA